MSLYTTGEAAKLCDVTVRTIQYYDKEDIVHPSQLSEGGRRLYSDEDISNLKKVCMIKSLGVSLSAIKEIMKDKDGHKVIEAFLEEQEKELAEEIGGLQERQKRIKLVRKSIEESGFLAVNSNEDIDEMIEEKKKMNQMRLVGLCVGLVLEVLEWVGLWYWIVHKDPTLFLVVLPILMGVSVFIVWYAYNHTKFLCPHCHSLFRPRFMEWFWASHTLKLRKVTCLDCGHKGMCIEKYSKE